MSSGPNEPIVIDFDSEPIGPEPASAYAPEKPDFWEKLNNWLAKRAGSGEPTVMGTIMQSMAGPLIGALAVVVVLAGWLLLASSSFTFGMDFIGAWLFRGFISDGASQVISGVACFILFDLSYTAALFSFMYRSKSNTQRAIFAFAFLVPFVLGLAASVTGFSLISENAVLTPAEIEAARQFGQAAIYGAIVNLALFGILPMVFDPDNVFKMLNDVMESDMQSVHAEVNMIMTQTANKSYKETARQHALALGVALGNERAEQFKTQYLLSGGADQLQRPNAAPPDGFVWALLQDGEGSWTWTAVPRFQETSSSISAD